MAAFDVITEAATEEENDYQKEQATCDCSGEVKMALSRRTLAQVGFS